MSSVARSFRWIRIPFFGSPNSKAWTELSSPRNGKDEFQCPYCNADHFVPSGFRESLSFEMFCVSVANTAHFDLRGVRKNRPELNESCLTWKDSKLVNLPSGSTVFEKPSSGGCRCPQSRAVATDRRSLSQTVGRYPKRSNYDENCGKRE